jgi:hypothetical protein
MLMVGTYLVYVFVGLLVYPFVLGASVEAEACHF